MQLDVTLTTGLSKRPMADVQNNVSEHADLTSIVLNMLTNVD